MAQADIRQYDVTAGSTGIFGRVVCGARNHHFIVDGPEQNGCPGEEVTPAELFLAGVACCGVELIQVLAKSQEIPLKAVNVAIRGSMDRSRPVRPDVSLFNSVKLHFKFAGISDQQASQLITSFKGRWPLYGTVAVATPEVVVDYALEENFWALQFPGHMLAP